MTIELKELLTLAAKACRILECGWMGSVFVYVRDGQFVEWAPHLDDGDNARMEATVGIDLEWYESLGCVESTYCNECKPGSLISAIENYTDHNNDRQAARRWASLRATAQVGKGM